MTKTMLAAPLFLVYTLTGIAQKPLRPVTAAAKPKPKPPTVSPVSELTMVDSSSLFIVSSGNFSASFNKQTGWLQQLNSMTDSLHDDTAVMRPGTTHELKLQLFSTSTSTVLAMIRTDYSLIGTPLLLHLSYTLNSDGDMLIEQTQDIDSSLLAQDSTFRDTVSARPGSRWVLPAGFDLLPTKTNDLLWFGITRNGHGMKFIADTSRFSISTARDAQTGNLLLDINSPASTPPFTSYRYLYKLTLIRRWP